MAFMRAEIDGAEPHRRNLTPTRPAGQYRTTAAVGVEPGGRGHWRILACCNIDDGMDNPSAFAALALMTSSNFVGCSTRISAGFAPRRILSTNTAPRANAASKSMPYAMRPPPTTNGSLVP